MYFSITDSTKESLIKNWDVTVFDSIDSTNSYARENAAQFKAPTLILAKHQTHGRGRGKNEWQDVGQEKQFLGSFVLPLTHTDPRWTMALGYFVFESLQKAWPTQNFSIKAPNDIYLGEKKVAGLLVEACGDSKKTHLILGLGLNVFAHPQELDNTATSLAAGLSAEMLSRKSWVHFIQHLAHQLENFEGFVSHPHWLANISSNLQIALNLNPHHRDNPVVKIQEDGSLQLSRGILNWLEL